MCNPSSCFSPKDDVELSHPDQSVYDEDGGPETIHFGVSAAEIYEEMKERRQAMDGHYWITREWKPLLIGWMILVMILCTIWMIVNGQQFNKTNAVDTVVGNGSHDEYQSEKMVFPEKCYDSIESETYNLFDDPVNWIQTNENSPNNHDTGRWIVYCLSSVVFCHAMYLLWLLAESLLMVYRFQSFEKDGLDPLCASHRSPVAGFILSVLKEDSDDSPKINAMASNCGAVAAELTSDDLSTIGLVEQDDECLEVQKENLVDDTKVEEENVPESCAENEEDVSNFICDQLQKDMSNEDFSDKAEKTNRLRRVYASL